MQNAALSADTASPAPAVTVAYPSAQCEKSPYSSIVGRGNVPLLIEDCLLAEVPRDQLQREWEACKTISDVDAADYCRRAAGRLSRAFESEIASADLSDIVANAAVLFLLSLRKSGIVSPDQIGPCEVCYDGTEVGGRVSATG
ncbi:MAG: hypothetical protein ACR2OL_05155 [Anderseniella sp.]